MHGANKGDGVNGLRKRDATTDRPPASRSTGRRFGELGDRLVQAFSYTTPVAAGEGPEDPAQHPADPAGVFYEDPALASFPITRLGYDCQAVDEHLAELEAAFAETQRELAELRAEPPSRAALAAEIRQLGEQTSAILITAQDSASTTVGLARAQAQICIADAASYAAALREEANLERRRVEAETEALQRERARLMQDIKNTAAALSSLAGS
jgi:hypothetical protein